MSAMLNEVVCCLLLSATAWALAPPLITHQPDRLYEYILGETVILHCSASGNPAPTYTWSHDDVDISFTALPVSHQGARIGSGRFSMSPGSGNLNISDSKAHDQGYYKCRATNELGTAVSYVAVLVRAMLENFGKQGGGEVPTQLGASLSLTCAQRLPASYPPPVVYWSKRRESNDVFVPIEYSNRISQDPSGTLHFANVYNSSDAGRYRCNTRNTMLRREAYSAETAITIVAGTTDSQAARVVLLYPPQTNTTVTVVENKELRLKCIFGGNPTPMVKWSKSAGAPMSDKAAIGSSGQELSIASATISDAGTYQCLGESGQLPIAIARVDVTVNVPPRIISKPGPVVKGENETVTFTCEGSGIPKPTTTWYVNGKPITGRNRTTVSSSSLTITGLKLTDTACIQCNVSHNETGWDAVSFYVLVHNEPPRITAPHVSSMKLAEGNGARFVCQATGHPAPSIRWQKDGMDIGSVGNATLSILKSKIEDTGIYTCISSNGVGQATFDLAVYVRQSTRIITPPQDQTVGAGEQTSLECEATTDQAETQSLSITWKKNRTPIDFGEKEHENKKKNGMSLHITDARVGDSGLYTCRAGNGIDEAEASGNLLVQGLPDPPSEVKIKVCNSNYAELQWSPGADNNAAILDYRVEYRTQYANQWIEIAYDIPTLEHSMQLLPWSNYTFRVKARNTRGTGEASLPTPTTCMTPADVPSKNPVGVKTLDEDPTKLIIAWQLMAANDHNGPGFYYEINYTRQDPVTKLFTCPPDSLCHRLFAESSSDPGTVATLFEHKFAISNQPVYTAYNISIRSHNSQGPSSIPPQSIIGHSGEGTPEVQVTDFGLDKAKELTARNASFIWTHVNTDPQVMRGLFKGYMIRWWKEGHEQDKNSVAIALHDAPSHRLQPAMVRGLRKRAAMMDSSNGSHVYATIGQLPPYTQLYFDIAVLNRRYKGPECKPISFRTRSAAPGSVRNIITKDVGPTVVVVEWGSPTEPNGEITGYSIAYRSVKDADQSVTEAPEADISQQYPADIRHARLTSLLPKKNYRITIKAFTDAGPGSESSIDVSTSSQGKPDAPTVLHASTDSGCGGCLNVSWIPASTGVAASSFYVEHRQEGDDKWFEIEAEETINWIMLKNLTRGIHEVRVVASNGNEFRTHSETTRVHLNVASRAEVEEPRTVFASAWFIGLVCGVSLLIILIIGAIFVYRQRLAGRYSIKETVETQKLKPEDDDGCSSRAYPSNSGQPGRSCAELGLDGLPKACENGGDDDSGDEFQDEDATKFDEDGSFIQAYREDKLDDSRDQQSSNYQLPTSSNGTATKDDRAHAAATPSPQTSPQLSTFQQHRSKSAQQPPSTPRSNVSSTVASRSGSSSALHGAQSLGGANKTSSPD